MMLPVSGMVAFAEVLQKQAGLANVLQRATSTYGRQMALGAGAGALVGAGTADEGHRFSRALKGGLAGGALAGGRILTTQPGRVAAKKSLGNFFERQRYGVTGRGVDLPKAYEIGLLQKANPQAFENVGGKLTAKGQAAFDKALSRQALQEDAFHKGYHTVPGVLHGALSNPKDLVRSSWNRMDGVNKALAGLGAAQAASGFLTPPQEGGPGRMEKGLRGLGTAAGFLVAPQGLLAGQLVGEGGGAIGRHIGKGVDRLVSRPTPAVPAYPMQ